MIMQGKNIPHGELVPLVIYVKAIQLHKKMMILVMLKEFPSLMKIFKTVD
jgi:hypothetical protein